MNLGIGLGLTNYLRVPTVALDPDAAIAALFESGEEGAWYDPSDSTTVFQDAAGTTAAGVGDPVGLILDKSKGLTLGSELVTNGTFDTDTTGWATSSAVLSVISGQLAVTPDDNLTRRAYQSFSVVAGKTYVLSFDYDKNSATSVLYFAGTSLGSGSDIGLTTLSGAGSVRRQFVATGSTLFIHFGPTSNNAGLTALFDNISVRELPGNHATQTTSAARPVLQSSGGLYYLDFDGVDDWLGAAFAAPQAQPNTLAVGFKYDTYTAKQYDWIYNSPANTHSLYDDSGTLFANAGVNLSAGSSNTNNNVVFTHFNTASSTNRVNGVEISTGNIGSTTWNGVYLCKYPPNENHKMDGRIYSFVGVNRTLTSAETLGLESYLANKSGVTL